MEVPAGAIVPNAGGCALSCLATPRASRSGLAGWHDGRLKVMLAAPPVDGAANSALTAYLAEVLGVAKRSVKLLNGETSRRKTVAIEGMDAKTLTERLAELLKQ